MLAEIKVKQNKKSGFELYATIEALYYVLHFRKQQANTDQMLQ